MTSVHSLLGQVPTKHQQLTTTQHVCRSLHDSKAIYVSLTAFVLGGGSHGFSPQPVGAGTGQSTNIAIADDQHAYRLQMYRKAK